MHGEDAADHPVRIEVVATISSRSSPSVAVRIASRVVGLGLRGAAQGEDPLAAHRVCPLPHSFIAPHPSRAAPAPIARAAGPRRRADRRGPASRSGSVRGLATSLPTRSSILRTWRLRPSRIVSSISRSPVRRTSAGAVGPSSSLTPVAQPLDVALGDRAAEPGPVRLRHAVAGMGEEVGELAVVGQQDQPGRVGVEPTDRVEARARTRRDR